jgi:hypothetical protein
MADRFTHDKPRTETARLKDLPLALVKDSARDPSEGRGEGGRFAPGNQIAVEQGIKALIREALGDPKTHEGKAAHKRYRGLLRKLPSAGPNVRELVVAQVRNINRAIEYDRLASEAGLGTPAGMKLSEAARAHDKTAQGLSTAAYDRATREAASKPDPYLAGIRRSQAEFQARLRAKEGK